MPMKTESPDEPAGQVPIGGSSAARAALLRVAGKTAPPTTAAPACKTPRRVIGPDFGCMLFIAFLLGSSCLILRQRAVGSTLAAAKPASLRVLLIFVRPMMLRVA